jgi:hypothetical protein
MKKWSADAFAHRMVKRLHSVPSLEEVSAEVLEVCPVEFDERRAAFYLKGQLEKVRGIQEETNQSIEDGRISAGTVRHESTMAYRVKQSVLVNGVVYCGRARIQKVYERERILPTRIEQRLSDVALPSSLVGNRYFGHFISEDACAGLMAQELSPVVWVQGSTPRSGHALDYLDIYRLPHQEVRTAFLENAWLFQDFAMNSHKRHRLKRMRELIGEVAAGFRRGHGVFFRRRGGGIERGMLNEAQIEARLEREGFEIVDVNHEDTMSIINKARHAEVVVGVEGSALMHGILAMKLGGALICIQPPYRFNNVLKDHSDAIGIRYGFLVGEGEENSFRVDEKDLMKTIDLAFAS